MNPLSAWRAYRWRKRVEWFAQAAEKARARRDSPWNMRKWPKPELVRKPLDWAVFVPPMEVSLHTGDPAKGSLTEVSWEGYARQPWTGEPVTFAAPYRWPPTECPGGEECAC